MNPKNVTLHLDEEIYEKYKKFCKEKGLMVSRQVELSMEQQMREDKDD